jgi:serine/threonine protein kinase HipA of HipAB toxin-antitoxin module
MAAASRVKVNIERTKLIQSLRDRLAEIRKNATPSKIKAGEAPKERADALAAAEEVVKAIKAGRTPRPRTQQQRSQAFNRYVHAMNVWVDVLAQREPSVDRNAQHMLDYYVPRIEKQIKLLELSDDLTISVGINDELYELL